MGKILLTAGLLLILSILIFNQEAAEAAPDGRSSEDPNSGENKSGKNHSKHSGSGDDDDHSKENSDEDDCDFDDDDDSSGHHKKNSHEDSGERKKPDDGSREDKKKGSHEKSGEHSHEDSGERKKPDDGSEEDKKKGSHEKSGEHSHEDSGERKKPDDGSREDKKKGSHEKSGEHHKHHHCRKYNGTLSHDDLVTLQYILVFLQTQDEGCTGYILFKGKYISVDFIFTYICIRGGSIKQVTLQGLWKIMQIYIAREQHSNSDGSEYHINKSQIITLQYILLIFERNHYSDQGKIEYNGYFISITDLKYYSDQNSINFRNMTVEQLLFIINIYIQDKGDTTSSAISLGSEPTEDQNTTLEIIVRVLQTQENNYNLVFTFYGYKINITFVIRYLQRENMDIKHINSETLWQVIIEYRDTRNGHNSGGNNEVTPSPVTSPEITTTSNPGGQLTEEERRELANALQVLQSQRSDANGVFEFNEYSISYESVIAYMREHNITYDELTIEMLYYIVVLISRETTTTPNPGGQLTEEERRELANALQVLQSQQSDANGVFEFNEYSISYESVIAYMREHNITYDELTIEMLYYIVVLISREMTTTSNPGGQLTEEERRELANALQVLQSQQSDANGVFEFNEYSISYESVIAYMREHNITYDELTIEMLYYIVVLISREMTTTSNPGGQLTEEERRELENALQVLQSQQSDATGVFEFNGTSIPYQFIIAYMREHNITFEYLRSELLYRIILSYQYQNVTFQNLLKMIQDPNQVPNLTLVYNSHYCPAQDIVNALGLKVDSDTGMYDTSRVTQEQLFDSLDRCVSNAQTTTEGDSNENHD